MPFLPKPDQATELRYALEVMEESSHLGLDDEAAGRLRTILQRRIREAEAALSCRPISPVPFPVSEKVPA